MSSTTLLPPTPEPLADEPAHRPVEDGGAPTEPRRPTVLRRLWRGPEHDPAWARPALVALLLGTAVVYLWGLGASGWANTYYAGAVQAATKSWKAFFYGSTDASNFITIDKTPLSIWPMAISARIFGLSSWSMLVPQALEGVAMVAILHATVKRWFGPGAALTAGAVAALTPVAALMFRFNNPDALLVLLLTASAYTMTRALEDGRTRWLLGTGALVGLAFLTKELQAFLVLPGFGLAYLVAGPPRLGRRIWQLLLVGVSTIAAAGWWVAIVQLTPASSRPYIGGSQNNSFWNVLFGYNGFGRLTGSETGSVGGGAGPGGQGGQWGPTGWTRLFNQAFGGQASWLIPAALILLVGGLVLTATRRRTDRTRAALILWGGWLVVTGIAISLGKGIIHEYYTVALVPAIGALVGVGGAVLWRNRAHWFARVTLAVAMLATTLWANALLSRTPDWAPSLRSVVLGVGIVVSIALLVPLRRSGAAVLAGALVIGLAAPAAYAVSTVRTPHTGALPTAGPASAGRGVGPGGGRGFGGPGGAGGFPFGSTGAANGGPPVNANGPTGGFPGGPGFPGGQTGTGTGTGGLPGGTNGGPGGGIGGLLNGTTVSSQLTRLLQQGSEGYRWTAASIGANNAASYQLASGEPIMAIGGFNGSDPAPTLAQFQAYVRSGKVHYFIGGGGQGGPGGSGTSSAITSWVSANFTARTVGGVTIYDLTSV